MNPLRSAIFSLAVLAALVTPTARAVVVPANAYVLLGGTSVAADPSLSGAVIAELVVPFSFTVFGGGFFPPKPLGTVSGSVKSLVVRAAETGTLDFYWSVSNDATSYSLSTIGSVELFNFAAPPYDADWRTDLAGDQGFASATSLTVDVPAIFFGMQFDTDRFMFLEPGDTSNHVFLRTHATRFALTSWMRVSAFQPRGDDGGGSGRLDTFGPVVPEPNSAALLLLGLTLVAACRRQV